jgi:hypothetical protein
MFMGIVIGSCVFVAIYFVSAVLISNYVTKDVNDDKIKTEYRQYKLFK